MRGTRDQERKRRGSWGSGVEKRGSPGTGFVMLNYPSRLVFFPLLSLSVENTTVNHRGTDYEGLISSASEQEHDSGIEVTGAGYAWLRWMMLNDAQWLFTSPFPPKNSENHLGLSLYCQHELEVIVKLSCNLPLSSSLGRLTCIPLLYMKPLMITATFIN